MDFDDRSCTIIDRLPGRFVDRVRITSCAYLGRGPPSLEYVERLHDSTGHRPQALFLQHVRLPTLTTATSLTPRGCASAQTHSHN
jgi:hypothetical protein